MNSFGKLKTDGELVYPVEYHGEPSSVRGNHSDSHGSLSSRSLSSRSLSSVPRSVPCLTESEYSSGFSSVTTLSTSYIQNRQTYALDEDREPLILPYLKCFFWFKDCEATFNRDLQGRTDWYRHITECHIEREHWDAQPQQLICQFCGHKSNGWGEIFNHAFQHIWIGENRPDEYLMECLEHRGIITQQQRMFAMRVAMSPNRRGPTRAGEYFNDHRRYDREMAYTLSHTGPTMSFDNMGSPHSNGEFEFEE